MLYQQKRGELWPLVMAVLFAIASLSVIVFALYRRSPSGGSLPSKAEAPTKNDDQQESVFCLKRVVDGDTMVVVGADRIELTIRLAGIDAPELGQLLGPESKRSLQGIVATNDISLKRIKKGKYGRYVADVFINGHWVNRQMVKLGYAWYYRAGPVSKQLKLSEEQAKRNNVGIWGVSDPTPPWEWREGKK